MSYTTCPSCGASDGQGCYSDCPTMLQVRVNELEREVQWHKVNSARRGEVEAALLRRVTELEAALVSVMIGGNSLAQIIGADHPPYGTSYDEALAHYGGGVKYEAWCCWNSIMQARTALNPTTQENSR